MTDDFRNLDFGYCPVCGRDIQLRKDGMLHPHNSKRLGASTCPGWGHPPAPMASAVSSSSVIESGSTPTRGQKLDDEQNQGAETS